MAKKRISDVLIEVLANAGIERIYGIHSLYMFILKVNIYYYLYYSSICVLKIIF